MILPTRGYKCGTGEVFSKVICYPFSSVHMTIFSVWSYVELVMAVGRVETAKCQLVSFLLYMDDLKLYGRNPDQLKARVVAPGCTFSDDIQMKFNWSRQVYCCTLYQHC